MVESKMIAKGQVRGWRDRAQRKKDSWTWTTAHGRREYKGNKW